MHVQPRRGVEQSSGDSKPESFDQRDFGTCGSPSLYGPACRGEIPASSTGRLLSREHYAGESFKGVSGDEIRLLVQRSTERLPGQRPMRCHIEDRFLKMRERRGSEIE